MSKEPWEISDVIWDEQKFHGLGPQKKYSSCATSAAEKACLSRMTPNTWRPLGRGQDAESNLVNPHSFRNLSAYSWKIPLTVFIPSGLIPRTLLQSIQREQWFAHFFASDADRMPKWHNLLPQPFLILSHSSGRPPYLTHVQMKYRTRLLVILNVYSIL